MMIKPLTILCLVVATSTICTTDAFVVMPIPSMSKKSSSSSSSLAMGFFDNLKLIMSEEGQKNIAAYNDREKDEQAAAQREILERRRNPEKMQEYNNQIMEGREKLDSERSIWDFQKKTKEGYDPLTEWKKLRAEGKIQVGSDIERDAQSSRLGSEGLQEVRIDERMPYIEQGYVDESADVMGNLMNMFGGGKKKEEANDTTPPPAPEKEEKKGGWPW